MKFKDLNKAEVKSFVSNLINLKASIGLNLHQTTEGYWLVTILPLKGAILELVEYFIKCFGDEEVDRVKFTNIIALSICLPIETDKLMENKHDQDLLYRSVTNPTELFNYLKSKSDVIKTYHTISGELFEDCIIWLGANKYVDDFADRPVNYNELLDFISELIEAHKTVPGSVWKYITKNHVENSLRLLSRTYEYESEFNELEDSREFVQGILQILSMDLITFGETGKYNPPVELDFDKNIELNWKRVKDDIRKEKLPRAFDQVKKDIGPGLIWWMDKNYKQKVNLEELRSI